MRKAAITVAEALFDRRPASLDRFMTRVSPEPETGCWKWSGRTDKRGYGHFDIKYRVFRSHRVAYELFCGPVSPEEVVLHKCDNPCCVNPAHLQVGSQRDNVRDMMAKGRMRRPRKTKLTIEQVDEIRALRRKGATYVAIAKEYGVEKTTARSICIGKTWK